MRLVEKIKVECILEHPKIYCSTLENAFGDKIKKYILNIGGGIAFFPFHPFISKFTHLFLDINHLSLSLSLTHAHNTHSQTHSNLYQNFSEIILKKNYGNALKFRSHFTLSWVHTTKIKPTTHTAHQGSHHLHQQPLQSSLRLRIHLSTKALTSFPGSSRCIMVCKVDILLSCPKNAEVSLSVLETTTPGVLHGSPLGTASTDWWMLEYNFCRG